ncbi:MAG: hypothetical protein ACR2HY_01940 [Acidimicrobiales bacterium]
MTLVWRDGAERRVDVRGLVPGDVIDLRVGDLVPADVRPLSANQLECDEAVLTGESMPAVKSATADPDGDSDLDLHAAAFMGTVVLPAHVAQPDPAQQPALRRRAARHPHRPCRP